MNRQVRYIGGEIMIFTFAERPSDSSFVERIWYAQSERAGAFSSLATSHWEMVVARHNGKMTLTVRGPETKATPVYCSVQAEWFGIIFKLGSFMPHLPASDLIDGSVDLPEAASTSFWLHGSVWQFPNYDNADTFVDRLVREGLLVRDPIVDAVLRHQPQALSPRSIQRRFLRATGLTQGSIRQIERARYATTLLQQGLPILDTVVQAGYADQAHLTRSLKYFSGKTPAQIVRKTEPEQMSFLFKTVPLL
jgi:AraC-like DNA-binding protein